MWSFFFGKKSNDSSKNGLEKSKVGEKATDEKTKADVKPEPEPEPEVKLGPTGRRPTGSWLLDRYLERFDRENAAKGIRWCGPECLPSHPEDNLDDINRFKCFCDYCSCDGRVDDPGDVCRACTRCGM
jgi:hypothetical protein